MLPLRPELPELREEELEDDLVEEVEEDEEEGLYEDSLDFELEDERLEDDDRLFLLALVLLREDDRVYPDRLDRGDRFLTLVPLEDWFRTVDPFDLDVLLRIDDVVPEDFVRVLLLPETVAPEGFLVLVRVDELVTSVDVDVLPIDELPPREVPPTDLSVRVAPEFVYPFSKLYPSLFINGRCLDARLQSFP